MIRNLFRKSVTSPTYDVKRKNEKAEMDEKITREEYTLDWSQSKVFLVNE